MQPINDPAVIAEVAAAFTAYEEALVANDVTSLDRFFWADERAVRYGVGENLYGHTAIAAYRAGQPAMPPGRTLEQTVITAFGADCATVSTLFRRTPTAPPTGRQTQTWIRLPEGWRIVAAHVSELRE